MNKASLSNLRKRRVIRITLSLLAALILAYVLCLIPDSEPDIAHPAGGASFLWDRDAYWDQLEQRFNAARKRSCDEIAPEIDAGLRSLEQLDVALETLDASGKAVFELAPLVAACPERQGDFLATSFALRAAVKRASVGWDVTDTAVKRRMYTFLYGLRTATEEVLLQQPGELEALIRGTDVPSASPSVVLEGVRVHSGDLLLSRGGAATSALIARGNDFPGNFSHVALAHVDDSTGEAVAVEAHIERGVAVATVDEYLADQKLRVLVLRPRADLPAIAADPLLPHRAAEHALSRARSEHIPYDFAMNAREPSRLFCSEVASEAYRHLGVELWLNRSTISGPGVSRWLADFGVEHFRTEAPSDLEYDPQLTVVAEWRDPETLLKDHLDNAVTDALIERAEAGLRLGYSRPMLPLARAAKAYSWLKNLFGGVGPVPEGMSATSALKNEWYTALHRDLVEQLRVAATAFERRNGYRPPYWELVALAREAAASHDAIASPL